MSEQNSAASASVNRAKPYQLMLFPLNNGATNVYYVLVLSYIATAEVLIHGLERGDLAWIELQRGRK